MVDTGQIARAYVALDSAALKVDSTGQLSGAAARDPGFLQQLAVMLSGIAFALLAYSSMKRSGEILHIQARPNTQVTPGSTEFLDLQEVVRVGSLALHERLYTCLQLLAVAGSCSRRRPPLRLAWSSGSLWYSLSFLPPVPCTCSYGSRLRNQVPLPTHVAVVV